MKKTLFLALLLFAIPLADASYVQTTTSGGGGGSGITSLNTDTSASQALATGTSGTDFAIVDDLAGTHTFNLPSASATARGVVTTGAQTFAGAKTFSGGVIGNVTGNASTATALASNPTDCSAGQFANAIDASGNLTCASVLTGTVWDINGMMESPTDKTYTLVQKAAYSFTINTLDIQTVSGTTTAAVKINGTSVTGISAVSVSSTPATGTATAANSVSAGDTVTLVLSSSSSPADLSFTLKYTR